LWCGNTSLNFFRSAWVGQQSRKSRNFLPTRLLSELLFSHRIHST
jgi:hypothetical protein